MENSGEFCAPSKGKNKYTCYSFNSLKKMAKKWNTDHKNDQIEASLFQDGEKRGLYKALKDRVGKEAPCQKDYCWNKHPIVTQLNDPEIIFETFRPEKPNEWYDNHKAWLSTSDIQHVLLQYEDKYPEFFFIGPVPIDFDKEITMNKCISDELCKINIPSLYDEGKRYIGVVFNLDPHDAPGSHWVSLFADLKNGGVYYYDSVGKFPKKEVVRLMQRITQQGNEAIISGLIDPHKMEKDHQIKLQIKGVQGNKALVEDKKQAAPFLKGMPVITRVNSHSRSKKRGGRVKRQYLVIKKVKDGIIEFDEELDPDTETITIRGFRLFYNDIVHQRENTECGVYSIDFISSLLNGESFQQYTANVKRDDVLNRMRDYFYRPAVDKVN